MADNENAGHPPRTRNPGAKRNRLCELRRKKREEKKKKKKGGEELTEAEEAELHELEEWDKRERGPKP